MLRPCRTIRAIRRLAFEPLGVLLLTGILLPTGRAQQASAYERGVEAFGAKEYERAATLFLLSEQENPGESDALLMAGKARVKLQRYRESEENLRAYLKNRPQSDQALYLLGFVLHREGKPKESLEIYTQAAKIKAPLADDLKIVGLDYILLNDYESAIHWLRRSVEMDPGNAETWYFLGRAFYTQGRLMEAQGAFEKALSLNPNESRAKNNLGLILESEGQSEAALEAYRSAIEMQSSEARASEQPYLNLGRLLNSLGREMEAESPLKKASTLAPKDAAARLQLGICYLRTKRAKEARRELEQSVALDAQDPAAHFELGRIYKILGLQDLAKKEFAASAALHAAKASGSNAKMQP